MNRTKAPSPDGFSAGFFQQAWPIVGEDVCDAIMEFFFSGRLLKEVSSTIITLVPKKKNATSMGDFRPASCCNLVYKSITKILTNRLVAGLDEVISSNQGAFVPKRSIMDNILLAQELVCNYHRTVSKARCTLKIDLMKAYDSFNWDYVLHCLGCLGAPTLYVNWVKECITSPRFTLALNGTLVGYFKGRKGLGQGDPLSPYLFVIATEGLSWLLEEAAIHNPLFDFHPKCSSLKLTHLYFVDDLFIFSSASCDSIKVIKDVLKEFEELAGLKANSAKSSVFFGGEFPWGLKMIF
jgi:hypothetical protein